MTITLGMILICILIFVIINFIDKSDDKMMLAIKYGALYTPRVEVKKEYWRFLTAHFVHVDLVHIFMNCYAIYYLGSFFEAYLGTLPYLYLVVMSAICSSLITYMYSLYKPSYQNIITLGASGIFYGYLGAMITLGLIFKGPFLFVLKQYIYVIAINIAFTFINKGVSKTGHFGGLIGGIIGMIVLIGTGVCGY